jgi:hypothetical protein
MKTLKSLVAIAVIALISLPFSSCEDLGGESCEQQDMNEILDCGSEKNVEVCCETGSECVYKYNGQEYSDTTAGLTDLADALGCTYKGSDAYDEQMELIINSLVELKEKAKMGIY